MIAKLPPHKARHPKGVIQVALILTLIVSSLAVKARVEHNARVATVSEYAASRDQVWASIDSAVANRDLNTLLRIQSRYGDCVRDSEFKSHLNSGLARLSAREAEVELAISKHLDLARHQEEVGTRQHLLQLQLARQDHEPAGQQLSVLPP